jgi:hypothetical protein
MVSIRAELVVVAVLVGIFGPVTLGLCVDWRCLEVTVALTLATFATHQLAERSLEVLGYE